MCIDAVSLLSLLKDNSLTCYTVLWLVSKAGFTRSSFLQKESCLNILSVCKVPRKIIEQDCWQYCAIKILPRVKALFKKKVRLAAILLGIERGSIFPQDFSKFSVENAIVVDRRSKDVNK